MTLYPIALLLLQIALSAALSLAVIVYLRGILRRFLLQLCPGQQDAAEYWVRLLDVMMLISPLILILLWGTANTDLHATLRKTMLLSLLGQFIGLVIVGGKVHGYARNLQNKERQLDAAPAPGAA